MVVDEELVLVHQVWNKTVELAFKTMNQLQMIVEVDLE